MRLSTRFFLPLLIVFLPHHLLADEAQQEINWQNSIRSKALESFDKMLAWTFNQDQYSFALKAPKICTEYRNENSTICDFAKSYGYFSDEHPLVAKVTDSAHDIELTNEMMKEIHRSVQNPQQRAMMTAEVLTKVLAYRDLKLKQTILIPTSQGELVPFEVDAYFEIGRGLPAFGLIPQIKGTASPILIFRGTDVSLFSQRGLASVISDLDPKGPGLSAFLQSKDAIQKWLQKSISGGQKARVLGFSLGGALACYTYLYEQDLLTDNPIDGSCAFNPPGVSKKIYRQWQKLPASTNTLFRVYATKGDLIPKIGRLVGDLFEIGTDKNYYPIAAHVGLITAEKAYQVCAIDEEAENHSKRFSR